MHAPTLIELVACAKLLFNVCIWKWGNKFASSGLELPGFQVFILQGMIFGWNFWADFLFSPKQRLFSRNSLKYSWDIIFGKLELHPDI